MHIFRWDKRNERKSIVTLIGVTDVCVPKVINWQNIKHLKLKQRTKLHTKHILVICQIKFQHDLWYIKQTKKSMLYHIYPCFTYKVISILYSVEEFIDTHSTDERPTFLKINLWMEHIGSLFKIVFTFIYTLYSKKWKWRLLYIATPS